MNRKNNDKKTSIYIIAVFILLILAIIVIGYLLFLKSEERIKSRTMTIDVKSDGRAVVEDIWDVNIVNSSTLYISFNNATKEQFSNIRVSRLNKETKKWETLKYNDRITRDGKEPLNRYHAGMFQGEFEIAWGVGLASSRDRRQYKIEYEVNGPLVKYLDTAQYYHMLVGKSFGMPIEKFYALVSFPEKVDNQNTKIWGHGAPNGEINFKDGKIEIKASKIPKNTFVEGRALLPTNLFYSAPTQNLNKKAAIIQEEERNTRNTYIAAINEKNRRMYFQLGIAGITAVIVLIIIFETLQNRKLKLKFPDPIVREWERYSDLPQTKLDILAANMIYKDKGSKEFLITMLMKLAHKKYIEIIEVKNEFNTKDSNSDISILDEGLVKKIKVIEKIAIDKGIMVNPREIAEVYTFAEKKYIKGLADSLKLKEKDLNNIKYKLNIDLIDKAKEKGKLETDEEVIIEFLQKAAKRNIMSDSQFKSNIQAGIKKNRSVINFNIFNEARKEFYEEIEVKDKVLYIEQYQIINEVVKHNENYEQKYQKQMSARREQGVLEDIYSLDKKKKASSLKSKTFIEIGLLLVGIYLLFKNLIGDFQFNENEYIIGVGIALIGSVTVLILNYLQDKRVTPPLTEKGLNIYAEFKGLFNFLSNDSFIAEYPEESVIIWGEFLVLATYFGIADKVLKTLKSVHPEITQSLEANNYSMLNSYAMWGMLDTINTSTRNIAIATAASTAGSAISSGGGGGFSSGGGGGFGGGGGGSR